MITLEELRSKTKKRLIIVIVSLILPLAIAFIFSAGNWESNSIYNMWKPYSYTFPYLLCLAFVIWLIVKVVQYVKILKNDEYALNKLTIRNDERLKYIGMKADALATKIMYYIVFVGVVFASFMKHEAFWPLLIIFVIYTIVEIVSYIYYRKKL